MVAGPTAGKVYVLVNETGSDRTIKNDTGATAANRIYTGSGADLTLKNQAAVTLIYNSGLSRWVVAGGSGGGGLSPNPQNSNFTAAPGNNYLTDTSGGAITATLPAGTTGATIRFVDATESWGTNNLTITPASGEEIDLLATDESLICDVVRGWVELSWNGTRWAFSSLASTTVGEASASSPGIVSIGTQTFAGNKTFNGSLTPSGGIVGKTDGASVSSGFIGEIITASSLTTTVPISGGNYTATALRRITLSKGQYMIVGKAIPPAVTGTIARFRLYLGVVSGSYTVYGFEGDTFIGTANTSIAFATSGFLAVSADAQIDLFVDSLGGSLTAGGTGFTHSFFATRLV